jgi:hypothetical protein
MDMSSPRCAARWSSSALGTKRTNAMAPVMSAKLPRILMKRATFLRWCNHVGKFDHRSYNNSAAPFSVFQAAYQEDVLQGQFSDSIGVRLAETTFSRTLLARAVLTPSDRGGSSALHPYPLREANANL